MADQDPAAAATDAPEGDELDEALEGEEPEAPEGGETEWKAPTREEWEASQAALEAERAKLKRARAQAERLRKGGKPGGDAPEGGAPAAADSAEVGKWQDRAVRAAARADLLDRGADPEMVDLALARLKPREIEFNSDDEPELDDWLDDMQERYPKLFAKPAAGAPAQQPRAGRVNQAAPAAGTPTRPKLSLGEAIIARSETARLNGRRGIRG